MIDVKNEQLRLLTKASADVPGRPHVSTLIRWALRGVKGVALETVLVGGRRYTSVEAIGRFLSRLNEPQPVGSATAPQKRRQEIARAEKLLDAERI